VGSVRATRRVKGNKVAHACKHRQTLSARTHAAALPQTHTVCWLTLLVAGLANPNPYPVCVHAR